MVYGSKSVISALQLYDDKLFIKWNNEKDYFELWRKMPWGSRLITPVTKSIYNTDLGIEFTPLDMRLVKWVKGADSVGYTKARRWLYKKRFDENEAKTKALFKRRIKEQIKDSYNVIHEDLLHAAVNTGGSEDWVKPDVQTCRRRTFVRSANNAKEYFGDNE